MRCKRDVMRCNSVSPIKHFGLFLKIQKTSNLNYTTFLDEYLTHSCLFFSPNIIRTKVMLDYCTDVHLN